MQVEVGAVFEGKVTGITKFGAFVEMPDGKNGMVHISEVASTYVKEISDHVSVGQMVKVKVLSISEDGKVSLSMKRAQPPARREPRPRAVQAHRPGGFEWQTSTNSGSFEDHVHTDTSCSNLFVHIFSRDDRDGRYKWRWSKSSFTCD